MKLKNSYILAIVFIANVGLSQFAPPPEISEESKPPAPEEGSSEQVEISIPKPSNTDDEIDFIALPTKSALTDDVQGSNTNDNLVTIALDDVLLEDVVRMFSRISNANIIATPSNLTPRVTANLDGVEWKPALSSILAMHNMALTEKPVGSGVFSIVPKAANAPEPLVVETIFLKYTTVSEVTPVITSMLTSGRGSLSAFASRNAMVVRDTENNLAEIKLIIKDIDIQGKQVCVEALFMELKDSAIKQLGIKWDSLGEFGLELNAGPFSTATQVERNQSRVDQLSQSDTRSSIDSLNQTYDMYGAPDGGERVLSDSIDRTRDASSDIIDSFAKGVVESQTAILNVDSFNVILSALKETVGVSVVSNPKMIVANGDTNAFFSVGEREPITKSTIEKGTVDSPGDTIVTELDLGINTSFIKGGYAESGIELKVIPTIKTDNLIEAVIMPSLRRKTGEKTTIDPKTGVILSSYPFMSVKEIETRFTLESGQTVAIGGLTDTSDKKTTTKIPLLGDIPLIGKYLFSHTKDEKLQVETIIFVTLSIADPMNLEEDVAIPDRARLAHKRIIRGKVDKHKFDADLEKLNRAADKQMKLEDERNSSKSRE